MFSFLSFALSLHKINCTRKLKNKFLFLSFALSLHKINCTRKLKNKFLFLSFLLSLHNTNGSRVNGGGNGILFLCAVIDIKDKV